MSGERNTPLGTPVVFAPGKIPLVGEYAIVDEGVAVIAAIGRYARAQFIPRAEAMPRLVAQIVKRTQLELGEAAAALPVGSVLVNDDEFRDNGLMVGLGASAATAVATAGALLETLGLPIADRKPLLFTVADSGRRAVQGNVGSGADSCAATYGGLVQISRAKGAVAQVLPLTPPPGLHIVLFSAGPSMSPQRMVKGIKNYAKTDPAGFDSRTRTLRDLAQGFVEEVNAGRTMGALCAAGKYGEELASLGVVAQVPILNEAFAHAAGLARELGGVAKPTGAGGGDIGVGIFATSQDANSFRESCPPFLRVLDGDLDRLGVRCETPNSAEETEAVPSMADDIETAPTTVSSSPTPTHGASSSAVRWRILPATLIAAAVLAVVWFALPDQGRARHHIKPPTIGAVRLSGARALAPAAPPTPVTAPLPEIPEPSPLIVPSKPEKVDHPETQPRVELANKPPHGAEVTRPTPSSPRKPERIMPAPREGIEAFAPRAGRLSFDDF